MSDPRRSRVHQTLRHAAAAAHHLLDHHPLLQRLTARDLTREQYAQSLAAMHPAHVRLERQVHGSPHHAGSGVALSARRALLEADLDALDWPVAAVAPMPPMSPEPSDGPAAWWGRVYVLEGSRLGGAVIARCVRSSLGDAVPCRFFAEATAADGRCAWLAMLERALEGDDDLEQAIASARAAFAAYAAALDASPCRKRDVQSAGLIRASTSSRK